MSHSSKAKANEGIFYVNPAVAAHRPSCVIGIDVGGTNTDSVILENDEVIAWHKTPTTPDIQTGVEIAIEAVIKKAHFDSHLVASVKIGTTQFVNAVLEQDSSKLDKVAVVRLCGPFSRGSPPFVDFPSKLKILMEGHVGYVDGGYQVDGISILKLSPAQLKEQARIIKSKLITSVVVIGIYAPSNPTQEIEACEILAAELGPGYDITCSSAVGRLGFLERENASILNASLRRFARSVIRGFSFAASKLGNCKLYITLNDGTLSKASTAADYPVRCFSSGPTNSARGAALLAKRQIQNNDKKETLVVDVGGTTTDVCALLQTGYPRQSAAFVKIAGVRTNFMIPDVHSIALGGGSIVRVKESSTSVGPDSVGAGLEKESIAFGGNILTANDLVYQASSNELVVSSQTKELGLSQISRAIETAIDFVKTRQGDTRVVLVGGGSIIIPDQVAGVGEIIRPEFFEVANAIGAAIAKVSGIVDKTFVPGETTIEQELENAKLLAKERCVAAGGKHDTIEIVEVDMVPMSYVTNGATRLIVRVVGDLADDYDEIDDKTGSWSDEFTLQGSNKQSGLPNGNLDMHSTSTKGSSHEYEEKVDVLSYRPRLEGDYWHLSELDLDFLQDGTGVLGVGSCGEPYPAYVACLLALRNGESITIRRHDTFPDHSVLLVVGFIGSPSVYLERIPGLNEVSDAMKAVMNVTNLSTFDAVIPNEIGGMNSFEALLAGKRFGKTTLDTDLVARAYPKVWQSVRCLKDISVVPSAVSDGVGRTQVFENCRDNLEAEDLMRNASSSMGSLAGTCLNPIYGVEAKTLPQNSFSHAWMIGRSIAISRSLKQDPVTNLLATENGVLLFTGKIISVTRHVGQGFTRGSVLLESFSESPPITDPHSLSDPTTTTSLFVEFENENLSAILKTPSQPDKILAVCPDLITFLDKANGAPLGITDYKYGLRVSVIALRAPPVWTTERGLEMGGPRAFGLDVEYTSVSKGEGEYVPPKSVWEIFGEGGEGL